MKKFCSFIALSLAIGVLAGCGDAPASKSAGGKIELTVVTPFSESDGNRSTYVTAYKAYEEKTGNTIIDVETDAVNEQWKSNVLDYFRDGNDPDVINFFTGADANELIESNKLVSISEIRKEFPDYASNMKESLLPVSTYDGRQYAVTVYGYWEGLFVNKTVLEDCGIAIPGQDYTWDQFLADCQIIKDNGYTPIACSLSQIPHYWFEYSIFNNGTVANHNIRPEKIDDDAASNWIAGLNDIKDLYDRGFFPENTNEADDSTTSQMILDNKAAFLVDGSWKVGWFQDNAAEMGIDADNFTVTYFPSKGTRKPTDAIGGFSMGYYITRKAWEDPAKRATCVEFVTAMTTDEVTSTFGSLTVTALKNGVILSDAKLSKLAEATIAMTKDCTAMVPAVQDALQPAARDALFKDITNIAKGTITAEQAVQNCIDLS
ncbi:hypothetical protein FACS1894219_06760 [Clostridia bacterium]|nr:hypothetical protein FACS1894219_06760 [Clostridia bacterium]